MRYSSTGITTHPALWEGSAGLSSAWRAAGAAAPQQRDAATMQGRNGLRANRLSCGNTARIEFFMFKPQFWSVSRCFKPYSNDWGDAYLSTEDVRGRRPGRRPSRIRMLG